MWALKQSTAIDVLFMAIDSNGDPVTGKVDGNWTKSISKNAAAFSSMTVTITERAGGWYHMQLSTSHTDTLGFLSIYLTASGVKQVNLQYRVFARILDDLAFPNTSGRGMDVDASGGVEVGSFQTGAITAASFAAGAIDAAAIATDAIDADSIATGAINSDAIGLSAADEIAASVWNAARSSYTAAGSFGEGIASVQGNVTGSIGSLGATAKADVNAEVVDVVNVDTISELAQAAPSATPTMRQALMLPYMAIRNESLVTSTLISHKRDDGTVVFKRTISDDGTTFTKQELVAGP
jgi:hypothetical protein